ncbi:MAG: helix-turn-helix transcriptional regulator [Labilithrix sp.]|nr:helix-turn-helix transcriptional regulator [Labilithrix sp.]
MTTRSHTPKGQLARARILRAAEPLFAARGFHGASMRDVADAASLPLATVVYHFARKEALYAAVLGAIADELLAALARAQAEHATARGAAARSGGGAVRGLIRWSLRRPERVRLLVRELLDNPARVSRAGSLPLAPVLTTLADEARAAGHPQPELAVLHVVGAVSYVVTARPTVRRIVGAERERAMMASYEADAETFARRALDVAALPAATPGERRAAREPRRPQRKKELRDGS